MPPDLRQVTFSHTFSARVAVKDKIEALGIPHTEVDLILADGARLSAYPVFESLDASELGRLRPQPLRVPRFVLDAHLGRLAVDLRCWVSTPSTTITTWMRSWRGFHSKRGAYC